ncbi:hypothetical protein TRSC58_01883 [Trypanosoma rangeli SC58]|uniref:Present in the outer mitochondrial membrane proteome 25 n=1 Tax=Trypanosoma rangeli SC58 TaxID=429131 RepID=A0A061J8C4_TRYRA|nr:hypothetical protein TRSC58_01883 [Trypanosoma rangeli SC58]
MFATVPQNAGARRGAIYAVSAALSSAFVAWAVHKWWKQRYRETGDEGIFDDIEESPLFDPDVVFPAKSTVAARTFDTRTGVGGTGLVSIAEREEALRMARHLVSQLCGEEDDAAKGSERSASSDKETNVSLNYRIATELEREARDGLVAMVVHGELLKMQAQGKGIDPDECEKVLRKLVEYFDISNEREKLRGRRIALHQAGATSTDFSWVNTDGYNDRIAQHMANINEAYGDFFSREGELERRLRAPEEGVKERFEVGWGGDDDDDDDADFMDYLDEDDAAGYGSRMEFRMGAAGRENLRIMDVDRGMLYGGEEDDGEFEEEEDSDDVDEKAGFERMLLDKLRQLAASIGERTPAPPCRTGPMTVPGAERHAGEEEEEKEGGSEDEWETASDEEEADSGGREKNN